MKLILDGKWKLLNKELNISLDVTVPGSVYNDLYVNNIIPDPYYRDNEYKLLKYMEYDYEYIKEFNINREDLNYDINLCFLGIDTLSEIYINDELVSKTYNMHRTYSFKINEYLNIGNNTLRVKLLSCLKYINERKENAPFLLHQNGDTLPYYTFMRKAHCMFGWDWGLVLPDAGIWKSCYIEVLNHSKIKDISLKQENDIEKLQSKLIINLDNLILDDANIRLTLKYLNNIVSNKTVTLEKTNEIVFTIEDVNLWYPVGYGEPNLYNLDIEVIVDDEVLQKEQRTIGFRNIEISQVKDEYGESFTPIVNNIPIFLKGSNYIIEDSLLPRTNKDKTRYLLESAVKCNHNTVRIWGGAIYPKDEFFELCDELGLLLWQDLMFACSMYDPHDHDFMEEIKYEIIDNVKRFKHHSCLLLICGNNEIETAVNSWNVVNEEISREFYPLIFEQYIPSILSEISPEIFYWPSSPSNGGGFVNPNDDGTGDMHYWGVWHSNEPITDYRKYFPRMMSEYGLQSFPEIKTIRSFAEEEELNIFSYVMECHQKNRSCNAKIMNYTSKMFKYPKDFESLTYLSQLIQAEGVRYCAEHLRRNYGRCMGSIYWQLNDCWPVASWSSIDYFGRFKALQYASKKFYQPIYLSFEEDENNKTLNVYLHNETLEDKELEYKLYLYKLNGDLIKEYKNSVNINKLSSICTNSFDLNNQFTSDEFRDLIVYGELYLNGKIVAYNNVAFSPYKHLNLVKPDIEYKVLDKVFNNGMYEYNVEFMSNVPTLFVKLDIKHKEIIKDYNVIVNQNIFSDNFFNLMPNKKKVINIKTDVEDLENNLEIFNLTDSF